MQSALDSGGRPHAQVPAACPLPPRGATRVYAAIGTSLFGEITPKYFGTLHQSVLTLFSVITLEGWVVVMDEVLPQMPAAWIYFVSFILFATFVAMNFFVGVIVNNLQAVEIEERDDIAEIRKALAPVEAQLRSSRDAEASEERLKTDQQHLERAS